MARFMKCFSTAALLAAAFFPVSAVAQELCIDDVDIGQNPQTDSTRCFIGARAVSILSAQPELLARRNDQFPDIGVTQAAGGAAGFSGPLWISLSARQSTFEDADLEMGIATVGGDIIAGPNGIFGVMLENDFAYQDGPTGNSFDGNGYLAGFYGIIQRDALSFDARIMGGISSTDVTGGGDRADGVKSNRWLAAMQVTGFMPLAEGRAFIPHAAVSWFQDDMEAYMLGLNPVESQKVSYGQANAGGTLRIPFDAGGAAGGFLVGASGIWGFGPAAGEEVPDSLRAKIDLGVELYKADAWSVSGRITGDGIGQDAYEAFGLDLGVTLWF